MFFLVVHCFCPSVHTSQHFVSDGLFVVVPQLFMSMQVVVCIPPLQVPKLPHCQFGVQVVEVVLVVVEVVLAVINTVFDCVVSVIVVPATLSINNLNL